MSQTDVSTDVAQDYYAVITDAGSALEAEAHAKGVPIRLTHIAVGDGDGEVPAPQRTATALVNEVYRREIDSSRVDPDDPNVCWISAVIPATVGGFWIREFGIYAESLTEDGEPVLYGYGNHAPYYKVEKILGQASTHELEIPVIMSGEANIQIAVKDSGYASQSAFNGLLTEIGQMKIVDQQHGARLDEIEAWQMTHFIATPEILGLVKPDNETITVQEDGTIAASQKLLEMFARPLNDEIIIEESCDWEVPFDGWYDITVIGGGNGGRISSDGLSFGGNAAAPVSKLFFLKKDRVIPVTVGAGGKGVLSSQLQSLLYGGQTSFLDIFSSAGNHITVIPAAGHDLWSGYPTDIVNSSGIGAGRGGASGSGSPHGGYYGAGGLAAWVRSNMAIVGNGGDGAVIIRFHNPEKPIEDYEPETETEEEA